jgi:hypothetical protein
MPFDNCYSLVSLYMFSMFRNRIIKYVFDFHYFSFLSFDFELSFSANLDVYLPD